MAKFLVLLNLLFQVMLYVSYIQGTSMLHDHLTDDEIFETFKTSRDSVPEYEVVQIIHRKIDSVLKSRSAPTPRTMLLKTSKRSINLNLTDENDVLYGTKISVYLASGKPDSVSYEKLDVEVPSDFKILQDREARAALSLQETAHGYLLRGRINGMSIMPLPHQDMSRFYNMGFPVPQHFSEPQNHEMATYHVVQTRKPQNNDRSSFRKKRQVQILVDLDGIEEVMMSEEQFYELQRSQGMINHNEKGEATPTNSQKMPDTVYPQILVTIDYDTFKKQGKDVNKIVAYMATFWNSIDLQYREITEPNVRPNLLGIVIPKSADVFPGYDSTTSYTQVNEALTHKIIPTFPKELDYDMVVSYTWRKTLRGTTLGVAHLGKACQRNRGHVLVADQGNFHAETTVAHEMAHSLGVNHDGEDPTIQDLNVEQACANPKNEGYMMSPSVPFRIKDRLWSECSVAQMRAFIRKYGECLYNKPKIDTLGPKSLPGKFVNRDQQCKRVGDEFFALDFATSRILRRGDGHPDINSCSYLNCMAYRGMSIAFLEYSAPLDGTSCGTNKICISGKCVDEVEDNYIS